MRGIFIVIVLLLPTAAAVNSVVHGVLLTKYVQRTRYLRTEQDILRLQKIVAQQMYAAVAQVGLLILPLVLYLVGIFTGNLYPSDLPLIIVPAGMILVLSFVFKKVEIKARGIPALNPRIEKRRNEIAATWKKRALPDW